MSVANISNVIPVLVVIIFLFCDGSSSQNVQIPQNPCPDTFKYIFDGYEYYGIITQRNTSETRREIKIEMTQPGILNQDYKGKISPNIPLDKISNYVTLGLPITYRVDFPQKNILPRVADITDNGVRVCNGPKDSSPRAEINMKIVLEKIISPELRSLNSVCGQENESVKRLRKRAVIGDVIEKSRFPWIAAIYFVSRWTNRKMYQCDGTLISKWAVISVAYRFCISPVCYKFSPMYVSLGQHDLNDDQTGVNIRVKNVIRHTDYRESSYGPVADIAIVQLAQSVTFSHAIRPICLWEGPTDLNLIEGITGVIVGWGEELSHVISTLPTFEEATIVPTSDCLRSDESFQELTSNRTFCAGTTKSGACRGDLGTGLMIKKGDKWILRGITSRTLGPICNPHKYGLYSDTAKFIDWIKTHMLV